MADFTFKGHLWSCGDLEHMTLTIYDLQTTMIKISAPEFIIIQGFYLKQIYCTCTVNHKMSHFCFWHILTYQNDLDHSLSSLRITVNVERDVIFEFHTSKNNIKQCMSNNSVIMPRSMIWGHLWPCGDLEPMTLTLYDLKTTIIISTIPQNPILDTEIMQLTCIEANI